MAARKTIYVKDDETWVEIEAEAKKRNWSASEYLIICHEELVRATEAFKKSKSIMDTEMAKILEVVVLIDEKLDKAISLLAEREKPVESTGNVPEKKESSEESEVVEEGDTKADVIEKIMRKNPPRPTKVEWSGGYPKGKQTGREK